MGLITSTTSSLFGSRPSRWICLFSLAGCALSFTGCGSKEEAEKAAKEAPSPAELIAKLPKGHGKEIKSVELNTPLNQDWVATGKTIYDTKCLPCHKLDNARVVGPGWAGITKRRQPLWIMNMITKVDMMLASDEEAQKLLELCLVRMPNMDVTEEDARKILEFMRHNDEQNPNASAAPQPTTKAADPSKLYE